MIESVESNQPMISEPLVHFGSGPAAEEKECAGVFTALELTHPSSALIARVAHTLQEENGKEQTHDADVIKAATNTEAQMTAGDLPTRHNSIPDRCASDPFQGGHHSAAVADAPLHTSQDGAAMLPGKCGVSANGAAQEISGAGDDSQHETPAGPADVLILEGGVGAPPDEWRINEANRRLQIIQTFDELLLQGKTKAEAAGIIGESYTSIWRYRTAFEKAGYNGLLPSTDKCGRKSWLEKLGMTPAELELLLGQTQGLNLDTEGVTSALRIFANSDQCPERLARIILDPNRCSKHAIPPSIRNVAKVNVNQRNAHRGPRRLSLKGFYIPRKMDVIGGDVFTADDTTPIYGWWVPWKESEEYPFGVKLLQGQFIPTLDVASQFPLTGAFIAREGSSYRAADIWDLFGHTFDEVGLPRLGWQLERGSWEANIIRGVEVTYGTGEATYSRRIGGLRQLPCNPHDQTPKDFIWPRTLQTFTSFLPKSKSIEAFFNRLQTLEGTLYGALGRDQMRRPFEKAKKIFQACQRGAEDPRHHFLSHTELAARMEGLLNYLADEPMEGEVFKGVPRQNWEAAVSQRPLFQFKGVPELEELRWLYRRNWSVVQITNGWARLRLTHPISGERYSLFYTNPSIFAQHEGEEVAVYFDRERFEDPAQIILAKTGEYLCEAQYVERTGSFLGSDRTGHDMAKQWRNAVMSTYITIAKHAPSRQLPPEIAARRAEAKAQSPKPNVPSQRSTVVDNRPAAAPVQRGLLNVAAPTPEQRQRNREDLSRQAALANQLRALSGIE